MVRSVYVALMAGVASLLFHAPVMAADAQDVSATQNAEKPRKYFWSGDWYLKVGAAGFYAPKFDGSKSYRLFGEPLFELGRQGEAERFSSRNDNISWALIDNDRFRVGPVGQLVFKRGDTIKGLNDTKFGAEAGVFVDVYQTDWMRVRSEVRHGIVAHNGVVADFAADAFYDVKPKIRMSGGPRATVASKDYFRTYYGVNAEEAAASGLSEYKPSGGLQSVGVGGAITWATTEKIDTSLFAEYSRLQGPARDSSIVKERGSANQFLVGVSATYRLDFSID